MKLQTFVMLCLLATFSLVCSSQNIPDKEIQISAALMAAPDDVREDATVLGYDSKGNVVMLKEGTNNTICLADNPQQEGFSVAAYHKDLEPFMARGRELKAEGKKSKEIFDIREEEAKSGKLKMPSQPTTLHILFGKDAKWDKIQRKVVNAQYRYVVYIPWATAESTGLPVKPVVPGGPWIMNPGTHRAHIMISTPEQK